MNNLNLGVVFAKKPIPEAVTMDDIYTIGNNYKDPRDRTLFYFCYLTGARISEALGVKGSDLAMIRSKKLGDYLTVRLVTRKNKRIPFRDVPVPLKYKEGQMVNYIFGYKEIETLTENEKIFPHLSRTNAWNRLTKETVNVRAIYGREILERHTHKINPHYLRHCRLTHLVQKYGFNGIQLMQFAGWSNTKPATVYVHLNWMDLAKVMSYGFEQSPFLWDPIS